MSRAIKNLNRALVTAAVKSFASSLASSLRVLDVGAGSGHYREIFCEQQYLAIDRGYEQSNIAGLTVVADIAAIPFAANTMDAAICLEVLEHVQEPKAILSEIYRVVRPGGQVMVSTPFCFGEHMQPYDFFRYTRFELAEIFVDTGFNVLSIQPRGGYFTLLAYLLARVPDELFRGVTGWRKMLKPLCRLMTTYTLAPLVYRLDYFDKQKNFTLGFVCLLEKT